ncbi:MAG: ATP-binding protein [Lentimicrobiaceae bacterium]|nr:ATP-binding protein [Lentimicrobiaceae bacterium]
MVYRKFRFIVVTRVLLLAATLFLMFIMFERENHTVTGIILLLTAVFQIIELIWYVERTNRKLTQFFESIRHSDFSTSFADKEIGNSFNELNNAFNDVITEFRKNRAEKEEHYNYLQTVVQHVSIGIIAYRKDGKVDIFNNSVKKLLGVSNLKNITDLQTVKKDLPEILLRMKAGEKLLVKFVCCDELVQLLIYATEFRMRGEEFILISLQNISPELEEKEIDSWQKLIRVLTHEIMNSITPISSLASTVKEMVLENPDDEKIRLQELDTDDLQNVCEALTTIQNRSQGLLNFVEIYRNLTRIPKPNFRYFMIKEACQRAELLMKPKLDKLGIQCIHKIFPEDLKITADPNLIDQVIINLLLNAMDAVKGKDHPMISIVASTNNSGRVTIDFADNGYGIKPDILDKIFMPFFTSKKEGSGIGLSLSRQIMHLHKGTITVKSKPNEGSIFTLTF